MRNFVLEDYLQYVYTITSSTRAVSFKVLLMIGYPSYLLFCCCDQRQLQEGKALVWLTLCRYSPSWQGRSDYRAEKIGHATSTSGDSSPPFLFYSAWEPSPGDGTAHTEDWSLTLTQPLSVRKTVVCLPGHLDSVIVTNLTATPSKHFSVFTLV